ncbi:hypothetical protein [Vibrio agarivorans]|uniref:hypothetical protein n=1 Tax=Vibrio agarivorans TaxID=153622 RepID=UPI0025B459B7|nr:hypothetical protein [Vibrio agarivorans]MDN3661183.1 hypothetical protein [Vibrio agarivorans]
MNKVTVGSFGNFTIESISPTTPSGYSTLDWNVERTQVAYLDNKFWLLYEAVTSKFGYYENGLYVLFSDDSDDAYQKQSFISFLSIRVHNETSPIFDKLKAELDLVWEIYVDAYSAGFKAGMDEAGCIVEHPDLAEIFYKKKSIH